MSREQDPLKIAFVGACCTGKSTLIDKFSQRYKANNQIAFVQEGARQFFRTNPLPENPTPEQIFEAQKGIREATLGNEEAAHKTQARVILCDTSVVDQVVYTNIFVGKKEAEELYEGIGDWMNTYSRFYMLNPHEVPYETDDVRKQTPEERMQIHETFLELFEEKGIAYKILSGTVDERFKTVDSLVQQVLPDAPVVPSDVSLARRDEPEH